MIRSTTPDDTIALLGIVNAIGFQSSELEQLSEMLTEYFAHESDRDRFWLTDEVQGEQVGVAYCEAERMTDQTWNLLLIAIRPDFQGQGRGGKLLGYVEKTLKARGGRMLLVETLASFDQARAFYTKCGFEQEALIRDFYAAGDDKVVFRKLLA